MRSAFIIAINTFREIIRDRILYGIVVFALILLGVSLALGSLGIQEQVRISLNFGFMGIQLSLVVLAIFVGSTLVYKEIEKQTVTTLLARPLSRIDFLLGKFFGLALVILVVMVGLSGVLLLVSWGMGFQPQASFAVALYGILWEALILLSVTLFFGSFSRPIMTVIFALGVFLIGHWSESLTYFALRSESKGYQMFAKVVQVGLPNLESFNWKDFPLYEGFVSGQEILFATLLGLGWCMVLLSMTATIFKRRDFV